MKFNKYFVLLIALLAFSTNASATNKTHWADTIGAGNSMIKIGACVCSLDASGSYVVGGTNYKVTGTSSRNKTVIDYYIGLNNTTDLLIGMPVYKTITYSTTYSSGATNIQTEVNKNGYGDIEIGIKHLFTDKTTDKISILGFASFTPSTAPSDPATAQVVRNGVLTTPGKTGKVGHGYQTTSIGGGVSIPTTLGDVFCGFEYDNYGEKSNSTGISKEGNDTTLFFGLEYMPDNRTTITPAFAFNNSASGYDSTSTTSSSTAYSTSVDLTYDFSKSLSLNAGLAYEVYGDSVTTYTNGDRFTVGMNGFKFGASAKIFF